MVNKTSLLLLIFFICFR